MGDDPSSDADFIRFLGVRIVDAESDERACKIVDGAANLNLPVTASLLAVSNKYGAIFVGTATGFSWAMTADLRNASAATSSPEDAAAALRPVASGGKPHFLGINADDTTLALAHSDGTIALFDVAKILHGHSAPASTHPWSQPLRYFQWSPTDGAKALVLGANGALAVLTHDPAASGGFGAPLDLAAPEETRIHASWSLDGAAIFCGSTDGLLTRLPAAAPAGAEELSGPPSEVSEGSLRLISPLTDRFTLLGYHRDDDDP